MPKPNVSPIAKVKAGKGAMNSGPKRPRAPRGAAKGKNPLANLPFRILDLPAEIRNLIYKFTLTDAEETVTIDSTSGTASRRLMTRDDYVFHYGRGATALIGTRKDLRGLKRYKWNSRLGVQLLRVNKQINEEASGILYSGNHFSIIDLPALLAFLTQIGSVHVREIRKISLNFWGSSCPNKTKRLAMIKLVEAVNLEAFILEQGAVDHICWGYPGPAVCANVFYENAHAWLWTVATRQGSKERIFERLVFAPAGEGVEVPGRTHMLQTFQRLRHTHFSPSPRQIDRDQFRTEVLALMSC